MDDRQIREPTLLALGLLGVGTVVLLGVCVAAMVAVPAFGYLGWTFTAVAALLAWLVLGVRRRSRRDLQTGRQRWWRRIIVTARLLFIAALACWLGLIVWLEVCPGGPAPPPKADAALVRVLTWNVHCGQEGGPPWKQFDWPTRKHALRNAVEQAQPDILCVQEATPQQVAFLEAALPGHERFGVGRDDGQSAGEHCAIYFRRDRFERIGGGTFWLEEPIDQPRVGSALSIKRICTWVRLRDRTTGRTLRVYNTHLYLTETPRRTAAQLILAHIAAGDPADAVVLTADFNAGPDVPSRRLFGQAGLADSAPRPGQPTFQLYGMGVSCLDGILVDRRWRVRQHHVVDVKPQGTFPSDHFGVLADLELRE